MLQNSGGSRSLIPYSLSHLSTLNRGDRYLRDPVTPLYLINTGCPLYYDCSHLGLVSTSRVSNVYSITHIPPLVSQQSGPGDYPYPGCPQPSIPPISHNPNIHLSPPFSTLSLSLVCNSPDPPLISAPMGDYPSFLAGELNGSLLVTISRSVSSDFPEVTILRWLSEVTVSVVAPRCRRPQSPTHITKQIEPERRSTAFRPPGSNRSLDTPFSLAHPWVIIGYYLREG